MKIEEYEWVCRECNKVSKGSLPCVLKSGCEEDLDIPMAQPDRCPFNEALKPKWKKNEILGGCIPSIMG